MSNYKYFQMANINKQYSLVGYTAREETNQRTNCKGRGQLTLVSSRGFDP